MHRRGHIYWVRMDKRRPALVISGDARNLRASDLVVIPCSTTLREAPTHVRLSRGEAGVPAACVLKCEQITALAKAHIDPAPLGGSLSPNRLIDVERAVLRAIGVAAYS